MNQLGWSHTRPARILWARHRVEVDSDLDILKVGGTHSAKR